MNESRLDTHKASLPLLRALLMLQAATREPPALQLETLRVAQTRCEEAQRAIEELRVRVESNWQSPC